jgi:hypothetical protein
VVPVRCYSGQICFEVGVVFDVVVLSPIEVLHFSLHVEINSLEVSDSFSQLLLTRFDL